MLTNYCHEGAEYYLTNYELISYDIGGIDVSPDRTAIECIEDGKVILFVCDSRISASVDLKFAELSQILKGIGYFEAIILGGGTTVMIVDNIQ